MTPQELKEEIYKIFRKKSVVILGFGREGKSTLELLRNADCKEIIISDRNEIPPEQATGCTLCTGEGYLSCLEGADIIMKTPGIGLKNTVSDSIKEKITSQTDILLRLCRDKVIGVTGTKGKSTVSSLIYHFLTACGKKTMLIGNIGVPPLQRIDELSDDMTAVCEMSCHQLEYVKASPHTSVLLNVYPEHLDHYEDFDAYRAAKLNITKFQSRDDLLVVAEELLPIITTDAVIKTIGFGCGFSGTENGEIYIGDRVIPHANINTALKGEHNLYNIAAAITAANNVGCDTDTCLKSLSDFNGLEHRLEFVGVVNGAEYINDSISTAPQTAIAALKAFPDTDTLIIGGMDRGIPYDELSDYLNGDTSVKNLIILPDSGIRAAKGVTNPDINKLYADNMEQAVKLSKQYTKVRCILSPAAASYGFYKNFEERGRHFKALVLAD